MNYDTIVTKGRVPWLPSAQATGLDVLHAYNIPLAGTFDSGGKKILFLCVTGATSRSNVWVYKHLTPSERKKLESAEFDGPDDLETVAHALFKGHQAALAYAVDGRISKWSTKVIRDSVLLSVVQFLEETLKASVDQHRRAAQARADVTKAALEGTDLLENDHRLIDA